MLIVALQDFFKTHQLLDDGQPIAIALSGGADSMALAHALAHYAKQHGTAQCHALTVNHALRPDAAQEAQQVSAWCALHMPAIKHQILRWDHDGQQARIQEAARAARYDLMAQACAQIGAKHLFTAHHQDDQAETFLMRLSAGSGVQGLGCMSALSRRGNNLTLARPLLNISKRDVLEYCAQHNIPFVQDPSNENTNFERVRMRKSFDILREEGLTEKRLATTARRCNRAHEALEYFTAQLLENEAFEINTSRSGLEIEAFQALPEEISLRLIQRVFQIMVAQRNYPPRLDKTEDLTCALRGDKALKARTLGGLKFTRDEKTGTIVITPQD